MSFFKQSHVQAALWMILWASSFNTLMILNKLSFSTVPLHCVIWGRTMVGVCVILPFLSYHTTMWRALPLQILRGLLITCAMMCSYAAYRHLPTYLSGIIGAIGPLFSLTLAALFLKEKITAAQWRLIFLAFMGVVIILYPFEEKPVYAYRQIYLLVCLFGSLSAGMAVIVARMLVTRNVKQSHTLFFSALIPFILYSSMLFYEKKSFSALSGHWLTILTIGLLGVLSQFSYYRAVSCANVSSATPFEYLRLCFFLPAGYIVFKEIPQLSFYPGACLILTATLLLTYKKRP